MYTAFTDSRFVTMFIHDDSIYTVPKAIARDRVGEYLRNLEQEARTVLNETGFDHVVYAVKSYDACGSFVLLDVYMLPLNDDDFYSRTESLCRESSCQIYALHKG